MRLITSKSSPTVFDGAAERVGIWRLRRSPLPGHGSTLPQTTRVRCPGCTRSLATSLPTRTESRRAQLDSRQGSVALPDSLQLSPTRVVQRWEEQRLVEAVARLRPDDQEVLRLVTWEELSHSQIAEVLGISVTAVGQRIHRATNRLRRQLKGPAKTVSTDTPMPRAAEEGRTT